MILQSLTDYYSALASKGDISQPGWCMGSVSFSLELSAEGRLRGVIPQFHEETRGKKTVQVPDSMTIPEREVRTVGVKANFLCDNSAYLLGFDDKGRPARTRECFEAAKALNLSVLKDCRGAAACAVRGFFETWNPETSREHPAIEPNATDIAAASNLVFRVDGALAHEDAEIIEAWARYRTAQRENATLGRCLVTGREEPIARLHSPIKGVFDAQSSGASLISINAPAYESYGIEHMPGAPVGEYAAFAYVTAINHLLADREIRKKIGDTTMVYWAEQADRTLQKVFDHCINPNPDRNSDEKPEDKLEGIMLKLSLGQTLKDVDMKKRFFILGLAPNAARISVRFFLQDTFGNILENLRRHYERLEIVCPKFDTREYLSVPALLYETINPNSRDKTPAPLMSGAVMTAILTNARYPQALYYAVINRIRADHNISRGRAAILKAFMIRNSNEREVTTVALNEQSNNRAYVLGRLFAVLENAQTKANPDINTTIKDRYFTSACATPGNVFPQLLRLSNHHTAKTKHGFFIEKSKGQLLDKLELEQDPFPSHQSLHEQGIFVLGYYHQVQDFFSGKKQGGETE